MRPTRLGAYLNSGGAEFTVASKNARAISVSIFDGKKEDIHPLKRVDETTFSGTIPGVRAGTRYGYRAFGEFAPSRGHYFAQAKLLVDPYAREIEGGVRERAPIYTDERLETQTVDSAAYVPRSIVTADVPRTWMRPKVPWEKTIVYELHVRGFTKLAPKVPARLRGTFLGLAHPSTCDYLTTLGVTTIELLPVTFAVSEPMLTARGATNYWGYNPLSFFALDPRFATAPSLVRQEFMQMVDALHARGIEVILDVVFNHTAEGGRNGSTLSFRGLDNASYYRMGPRGEFVDWTGCGNTLNCEEPIVQRLIIDALRYLHHELGVDGFRFDLASILGHVGPGPRPQRFSETFLRELVNDPELQDVKWIAEPWDVSGAPVAYGEFPPPFFEWNGVFRDAARRFWNRDEPYIGDMGRILTGTREMFPKRNEIASINFITAHDGFTLYDLVSYEEKHNEANGEGNRDGSNDNISRNFGVEGETHDPEILVARDRLARSLMSTLLLAPGVPMITAGDEMLRTQRGNNNAYCLDDETSWIDWRKLDEPHGRRMYDFVADLLSLRKHGMPLSFFEGVGGRAVAWLRPDGEPMQPRDWEHSTHRAFAVHYLDAAPPRVVLFSACERAIKFRLPKGSWRMRMNSGNPSSYPLVALDEEQLEPYSVALFEERLPMNREELLEEVEIAIAELKEIAQPHELATLREMLLDAREVEESQLPAIYEQLRSLRSFCESRKKSDANYRLGLLPRGRRH